MDAQLKARLDQAIRAMFVSEEVVPQRGHIPVGDHKVTLLSCTSFLQSWDCGIDADGNICDERPKEDFKDARFDQPIVILVFQDENGRVKMTRRSMKGWLSNKDVDRKTKKLIATPEFIRDHKLVPVPADDGKMRFIDADGKAFASEAKTETCRYYNNRFCASVGLPVGSSLLDAKVGSELMIRVEERDPYASKKTGEILARTEIADYATVAEGFTTKAVVADAVVASAPAPATLSW